MTVQPWELVTKMPNPLSGYASVKYNNRVYVMGGSDNVGATGEVVGSMNGRNYDLVLLAPNGFSPRYDHAACVFNERIFVTGGVNDPNAGPVFGDCICTENGQDWIQMTPQAPFAPVAGIYGHQMVAFGNAKIQLVVLGGGQWTNRFNTILTDDIWTSVDGKTWKAVIAKTSKPSPRMWHRCLVYNNRIWLLGGSTTVVGPALSDIWYTEDLEHWVQVTNAAPWGPLRSFACCVYDQRMWVIGGFDPGQAGTGITNKVWFSRNGLDWERSFDYPIAVFNLCASEIDNKIHAAGGRDGFNARTEVYQLNMG